jgi:hypothetical protein
MPALIGSPRSQGAGHEGYASIDRSDIAVRIGSVHGFAANTFGNTELLVALGNLDSDDPNPGEVFCRPKPPGGVRRRGHDVGERRDRLGSRRPRV